MFCYVLINLVSATLNSIHLRVCAHKDELHLSYDACNAKVLLDCVTRDEKDAVGFGYFNNAEYLKSCLSSYFLHRNTVAGLIYTEAALAETKLLSSDLTGLQDRFYTMESFESLNSYKMLEKLFYTVDHKKAAEVEFIKFRTPSENFIGKVFNLVVFSAQGDAFRRVKFTLAITEDCYKQHQQLYKHGSFDLSVSFPSDLEAVEIQDYTMESVMISEIHSSRESNLRNIPMEEITRSIGSYRTKITDPVGIAAIFEDPSASGVGHSSGKSPLSGHDSSEKSDESVTEVGDDVAPHASLDKDLEEISTGSVIDQIEEYETVELISVALESEFYSDEDDSLILGAMEEKDKLKKEKQKLEEYQKRLKDIAAQEEQLEQQDSQIEGLAMKDKERRRSLAVIAKRKIGKAQEKLEELSQREKQLKKEVKSASSDRKKEIHKELETIKADIELINLEKEQTIERCQDLRKPSLISKDGEPPSEVEAQSVKERIMAVKQERARIEAEAAQALKRLETQESTLQTMRRMSVIQKSEEAVQSKKEAKSKKKMIPKKSTLEKGKVGLLIGLGVFILLIFVLVAVLIYYRIKKRK